MSLFAFVLCEFCLHILHCIACVKVKEKVALPFRSVKILLVYWCILKILVAQKEKMGLHIVIVHTF